MMVILEGSDDTGKSTLATKLAMALKAPILKAVPSEGPNQPDQYYKDWVMEHLGMDYEDPSKLKIYDRFPVISEEIYGPLLRDRNHFSPVEYWIRQLVNKATYRIIYCRPPREVVLSTVGSGIQMDGVVENSGKLLDLYDGFMKQLRDFKIPVHVYDYTQPEAYTEVLEFIIRGRN